MTWKIFSSFVFAALLSPAIAIAQVEVPATITFDDWPPAGSSTVSQRLQLAKDDSFSPAFTKVASSITVKAGTEIRFGNTVCTYASVTYVVMPTLLAGSDYRIAAKTDCGLEAYNYSTALPSGAEVVGGFHYLPGGYPTDLDQGGNWTPTILEWSIWDLNFRPACKNPRGMTRVGNAGFWVDIYFAGDTYATDGVGRNNDTIITGTNPPVRSADYGGNGVAKLTTFNWWDANEMVRQWGKRLPSYQEMVLAGFGTNEGAGRGSHPVKTGFANANTPTHSDPNFTSKWGLIQATGVIWIWLADFSDWQGTATANAHGWEAYDVTGGRGKIILQNNADLTALLYGGSHVYTNTGSPTGVAAVAGSRTTETIEKPWDYSTNIAARGACDHMWR